MWYNFKKKIIIFSLGMQITFHNNICRVANSSTSYKLCMLKLTRKNNRCYETRIMSTDCQLHGTHQWNKYPVIIYFHPLSKIIRFLEIERALLGKSRLSLPHHDSINLLSQVHYAKHNPQTSYQRSDIISVHVRKRNVPSLVSRLEIWIN